MTPNEIWSYSGLHKYYPEGLYLIGEENMRLVLPESFTTLLFMSLGLKLWYVKPKDLQGWMKVGIGSEDGT